MKDQQPAGSPSQSATTDRRPPHGGSGGGKGKKSKATAAAAAAAARLRSRSPASPACLASLCLTAVSGFSKVTELEKTCVELSNASREGAAWKVKLYHCLTPPELFRQFWPNSELPVSKKKRAKKSKMMAATKVAAAAAAGGHKTAAPSSSRGSGGGGGSRLVQRRNVKRLSIVGDCEIGDLRWPPGLEKLTLKRLGKSIAKVEFPPSLAEIVFKGFYQEPIGGVVWPAGLRVLRLSDNYGLEVEDVVWPSQLERLTFGCLFNQVR